MDKMNFEHEYNEDGGVFYLVDDGERLGKITYDDVDGDRFVVDWVEVEPEYRGQGLARRLIDRIANFARDRGVMIRPTCGVTRSVMERHAEFADVLDSGDTDRAGAQ